MDISSVNWLAVIAATAAAFVVGFVWFGPKTFFPVWWRAMGKSPDDQPVSDRMGTVFGLTLLGAFVQALVLALVIGAVRAGGNDVGGLAGLGIGVLMGVGFAAATSLSHRLFAGQGLKVWAIEVGGDIAQLAAMGLVLGLWP
jgi:hypothetical protein